MNVVASAGDESVNVLFPLNVGDHIGIGEDCVGVIDTEELDRVHITSETFRGWASKDELRKGIAEERFAEGY